MTAAVLHARHRRGFPLGDDSVLDLPEAQPVIARIAAAVDPDYGDRMEHVRRVATIAVRAKLYPTNAYAPPTLYVPVINPDALDADLDSQHVEGVR